MNLLDLFHQHQQHSPQHPAILGLDKETLTYSDLYQQIIHTGAQLRSVEVTAQDAVAVILPNGPEMAVTFLSLSCFCAAAPLNPNYREAEYEFYLKDLCPKIMVVPDGYDGPALSVADNLEIPVLELVPHEVIAGKFSFKDQNTEPSENPWPSEAHDTALILHTSGTTSRPKMVPLSQTNILTSAKNVAQTLSLTPQDRCLNVMPLFHIHGLIGVLLSSMHAGATVACTPGYLAPEFFGWVQIFEPSWYSAVPTMHQGILQQAKTNADVVSQMDLRFIRSSSASLPPVVMEALEQLFDAPVIESYGMTEAAHQMASNPLPPSERKPGSVGPAAGPEVSIMDEDGNHLEPGITGEVVIKGPNVTKGYANNPEANQAAFTDGWFRTGDQGYQDDKGYFYITGRLKEIINRGGEKVSPREIDEVMLSFPGIQQATAFAIPHGILGEEIGLALILKEGTELTELEVREYLSQHLSDFKVPRVILFVPEIPKGPTGKLQRVGLAKKLGVDMSYQSEEQLKEMPFLAPRTTLEQHVQHIWKEVLKRDCGIQDNFFSLGGDSITATRVISRYSNDLSVTISFLHFFENPTVQDHARRLLVQALQSPHAQQKMDLEAQIMELPEDEAQVILKLVTKE